jgi:cyclopropane-fatty-acyl-phospholipid synthase
MPATTGMKGGGFYDQHSATQAAAIAALADWVDQATAALTLPPGPRPIVLLDLGSAEGRNALAFMQRAVAGLRRRQPEQPIQTVYSDLASNNFNQLFANLETARQASGLGTEVYASAAAGSFYSVQMPPGTVHLATCFNAVLWLDRLPAVPITDFVCYRRPVPPRPGLHVAPEAMAAFTQQAEQDWSRFLTVRARELAPGGKLLVATPGDCADARICDGIYDVLNDACLDLVATGTLPRARYERLTMPLYFRNEAELLAPLGVAGSALRDAFSVERSATLELKAPFFEAFEQTGDATALATAYTGFLRAFSEPIVAATLQGLANTTAIIEALYDRVEARIRAEPERYRFRYIEVALLLTRR